ncbi:MAG: secretion system protein, partial [Pyrinomonadaceae bacterium]
IELRDGQSFALAGLLDNNETQSLSKMPILGDIPILGNLFKSKSFQKSETELMFIVTAELVKPVNRDDLPRMKGVDGMKSGSLLGVEYKGDGITGKSGFTTGAASPDATAPKSTETTDETKTAAPSTTETKDSEKALKATAQPGSTPATTNKGATPK